MTRRILPIGVALLATIPSAASAQSDVEMLGRAYGTTPPAEYFSVREADPDAFTFQRAWMERNPALRSGEEGPSGGPVYAPLFGAEAEDLGSRVVQGTVRFPLVLGYFRDSPVSEFTTSDVQREFFDGPNSRFQTIPEFYAEISGGRVDLVGETRPWVRAGLSRLEVAGESSGLGGDARVGEFIMDVLSTLDDGTVDWGRYDNDGPDGVPNSGDDDGWVDILAVMHPTHGGECGGDGGENRVWSHKWNLEDATGQAYVTRTAAAGGGNIRVGDYTIQPVLSCDTRTINQIGVLAHELGHGFGLPDLYAVGADHPGIGKWGLMGGGSWGCGPFRPERPCHMTAWSKAILGWAEVETLAGGADHGTLTLPPVETTGKVYRVDARDGSGEYFLLENRQPVGFDAELPSSGLLVWHVDPEVVAERWPGNRVNSDADRMGVWLRQADALDELALADQGSSDAGDPFPGSTDNRAFHAGSRPSSFTHEGAAAGVTLLDIEEAGGDVRFRLLTRFFDVTVRAEGADGGDPKLTVDGGSVPGTGASFPSAPFQSHTVVAGGGAPVTDGVRVGFLGWADDPDALRERTFRTGLEDAELVARYGNREMRFRVAVDGEAFGVSPGAVSFTPSVSAEDGAIWFPEGAAVTLAAVPTTGFGFREWTGAAEGKGNPATLVADAPADVGAVFELTYEVPAEQVVPLEATRPAAIDLEASNGSGPIAWSVVGGALPEGLTLLESGRIRGAAIVTGAFRVVLEATDARGLEAGGVLVLEVAAPTLPLSDLLPPVLGGSGGPSAVERLFLDWQGNGDGTYDLGDFRAYVLAHPDLPGTAPERASMTVAVPVVAFPDEGGGP